MNFYKRINDKKIVIPRCFGMSVTQLDDLRKYAPSFFDAAGAVFKFGYMQGVRATKAGKAGNIA